MPTHEPHPEELEAWRDAWPVDKKEGLQREALDHAHGRKVVGMSFVGYEDGTISMFFHINHEEEFKVVESAVLGIRDHLDGFIRDKEMCPFGWARQ